MRIAIGQVLHETNTFSSERTDEAAFRRQEWCEGGHIFPAHEGVRDYIGGMIDEARDLGGIELVPTLAVSAEPSGIIAADTWERIKLRLLDSLRNAGPLDAICLALHGAGIAETSDDIEGELLHAIRAEFGRDIPIAATLDLHANMTHEMVGHADLLLGVNHYPHSDEYDRGREAIRRLRAMISGTIRPSMHLVKLPMLIPTSTTLFGPAKEVNEACWAWENRPGMLDCTFFHGFPYTDSPEVGASVLAVSDGDDRLAREAAADAADEVWRRRDAFNVKYPSPADGLMAALAADEVPVIINETSDNPGAGAPGDGTFLLREMLAANVPQTCFCHICDPDVVQAAHRAGVGARIEVELGGKTDGLHGSPVSTVALVRMLTDGTFVQTSPMWRGKKIDLGQTARLRIGNVDVIVTSIKSQLLDDELLKLHGIDMLRYKVIGIKSSQHFRGFFQNRVPRIMTVDCPGLSTFDFSGFDYRRIVRPIHPLDRIASTEALIVD
ncbi:M81 family metallopeptidase [Paenibacillus mesophilus]|uniref:M81 family metallopeptidase n=1 Tax=Paenibacillus mesophilus TaxID=2582849 RepID=UPI00110DAB58|nr:M81 family metallopeptidase [Paenibacillus mesophilus]TMV45449.1 M81 family metallopeptidase [Paenibacillus mesophilus]